jgi:hypothetical protein
MDHTVQKLANPDDVQDKDYWAISACIAPITAPPSKGEENPYGEGSVGQVEEELGARAACQRGRYPPGHLDFCPIGGPSSSAASDSGAYTGSTGDSTGPESAAGIEFGTRHHSPLPPTDLM